MEVGFSVPVLSPLMRINRTRLSFREDMYIDLEKFIGEISIDINQIRSPTQLWSNDKGE